MSYSHAIRITLPYEDVSGIIRQWADRSQRAIVFEHQADEEVSKTHVHLILGGCETKSEALKRMWKDAPGKGNEFWSWKDWDGDMKFITYMSKGTLREKFVKNFSQEEVEKSRQDWVEPVKADKIGDASERIIVKVVEVIKKSFVWTDRTDEDIVNRVECSVDTLCKLVRKEAFRQLWGEHRRVPHASHYKIIAGTAFMRLCEHYGCFEGGIEVMQNLWY